MNFMKLIVQAFLFDRQLNIYMIVLNSEVVVALLNCGYTAYLIFALQKTLVKFRNRLTQMQQKYD